MGVYMIRLKWIILQTKATLDDLAELFFINEFSQESSNGFHLNLVNNEVIEGEFIQRSVQRETIHRPDSSEEVLEIERFSYLDFRVSYIKNNYFLVELKNPPRTLSDFLNYIHSKLSHHLVVDSVELDVMKVVDLIKNRDGFSSVKIKKIKVSSIALDLRSAASIEIQSHENAYKDFMDNFNFNSFSVDCIKLIANYSGKSVNLLIKKTGISSDTIEISKIVKEIIEE